MLPCLTGISTGSCKCPARGTVETSACKKGDDRISYRQFGSDFQFYCLYVFCGGDIFREGPQGSSLVVDNRSVCFVVRVTIQNLETELQMGVRGSIASKKSTGTIRDDAEKRTVKDVIDKETGYEQHVLV